MKGFIRHIAAVLLLGSLALSSCSIKESRSECPCSLYLDYSAALSTLQSDSLSGGDSLLVIVQGVYNAFVKAADYSPYQCILVPRTTLHLSCHAGLSQDRLQSARTRLLIPLGEDSDRLFSYRRALPLDMDSEEEYVTPQLCRRFTRIVLEFEDARICSGGNTLWAEGTSCGEDLLTGEPLEGQFRCSLSQCDTLAWAFNMPRQRERDIAAFITDSRGEEILRIDLAAFLEGAGYDFGAESLSPLVIVHINALNIPVQVRIIDYEEAIYFNYTL